MSLTQVAQMTKVIATAACKRLCFVRSVAPTDATKRNLLTCFGLRSKIVLLAMHPTDENHDEELPPLKNERHGSPVLCEEEAQHPVPKLACQWAEIALSAPFRGSWAARRCSSAESFDTTGSVHRPRIQAARLTSAPADSTKLGCSNPRARVSRKIRI